MSAAALRKVYPNLMTVYLVRACATTELEMTPAWPHLHCSNVSGTTVTVRVQALFSGGSVAADQASILGNGVTTTFSTHTTEGYNDNVNLGTGAIDSGVFNIESTNPAVFCSAVALSASDLIPIGVNLRMIRVNPLPGTQE